MGEHAEPVIGRTRRRLTPRQYAGLAVTYLVLAIILGLAASGASESVAGLLNIATSICTLVGLIYGAAAVMKWGWKAARGD